MRNKYIIFLFAALFKGILIFAETSSQSLTVTGNVDQWNETWEVVDNSDASNLKVKRVKAFIFGQLKQQIDTTKK